MKLKSKLILAASSLLVLSGVAAGTSTFAWFAAQNTAKATFTTVNVNSNTDGLTISATDSNTADGLTFAGTSDLTATASAKLTDVSGDGYTLYKASTSLDSSSSVIINSAYEIPHYYAPYCYTIGLTFSHTNTAKSMAVFLDPASTITNTTTEAVDIANAVRVAIIDSTQATNKIVAYYAPHLASTSFNYFVAGDTTSASGDLSALNTAYLTAGAGVLTSSYASSSVITDATAGTVSQPGYLGTIATSTDLSLTAVVWVEGEDSSCTNDSKNESFNLNLKFYGVSEINA